MTGIKNNRRTKYTISVIENALVSLLSDDRIEQITVTQICQEADINRGTFYRYYKDAYDCLEKIQQKFIGVLNEQLPTNDHFSVEDVLAKVLTVLQENKELMRALLLNDNTHLFEQFLAGEDESLASCTQVEISNDDDKRDEYYLHNFYTAGITSSIRTWVSLDFPEEPKELAKKIVQLIPEKYRDIPMHS